MKKYLLVIVCALCTNIMLAHSVNNTPPGDNQPVELRGKKAEDYEGGFKRTIYRGPQLPLVWIENGSLCFESENVFENVFVSIEDNDGAILLATMLDIDDVNISEVDLSSIPSGEYVLNVTINDREFYAFISL